jgi:hypothetical protein
MRPPTPTPDGARVHTHTPSHEMRANKSRFVFGFFRMYASFVCRLFGLPRPLEGKLKWRIYLACFPGIIRQDQYLDPRIAFDGILSYTYAHEKTQRRH